MRSTWKPRSAARPRRLESYRPQVRALEARQQAGSLLSGPWSALLGGALADSGLGLSQRLRAPEVVVSRVWQECSEAAAFSPQNPGGVSLAPASTAPATYVAWGESAADSHPLGVDGMSELAPDAHEQDPLRNLEAAGNVRQTPARHPSDADTPRVETPATSAPVTAPGAGAASVAEAAPRANSAGGAAMSSATEAELSAYTVGGAAKVALSVAGSADAAGLSLTASALGTTDPHPELHPGTASGLQMIRSTAAVVTHACGGSARNQGPGSPPAASSPGGASIVFSTFHGDKGAADEGESVDVDGSGNVEVAGNRTDSSGNQTGFITTVSPDGSSCVTTDITDGGGGILPVRYVVHSVHATYLVGDVYYAPTGRSDGFIAGFNPVLRQFVFYRFHSIYGDTSAWSAGFDAFGRIYVTGWTTNQFGRRNVYLDRINRDFSGEAYFIWDLQYSPGVPANSCGTDLHVSQDPRNPAIFHVDIVGVIATLDGRLQQSFVLCIDATNINPLFWRINIDHRFPANLGVGAFRVRWERDIFGGFHLVFYVVAVGGMHGPTNTEELIKYEAVGGDLVQQWDRSYAGRTVTSVALGDGGNLYTAGSEGPNAFVDIYSPDGSQLLSETVGGGSLGRSVAQDVEEIGGNVYVTGWTEAADFSPVVNACQPTFLGTRDAFITKVAEPTEPQSVQVQAPASIAAGSPFNVTVTVRDGNGNPVPGYVGEVHLSSSDGAAMLPADYVFNASDGGTHTFTGVVLRTPGDQTVTATDVADGSLSGTASVNVQGLGGLINGGFETGDFTGWTPSGLMQYSSVTSDNPHSGTFAAHLGEVGGLGFIAQTVGTTPGHTYQLTYWLAHNFPNAGTPNEFQVSVGGSVLFDQTDMPVFGYTMYSFNYVATGPTTTIQFGDREDPSWFDLDDVNFVDVTP